MSEDITPNESVTPPPAAEQAPAPVKPSLRLSSTRPPTAQEVSRAVKLPNYAANLSSPMPSAASMDRDAPSPILMVLATLSACAACAFAVLIYLKQ